jgi:hypothetical protein
MRYLAIMEELPKKFWWQKKDPTEQLIVEIAKLVKEVRRMFVWFRRWYFDNPKDKFEKWIARTKRGMFWLYIFMIIWEVKGR